MIPTAVLLAVITRHPVVQADRLVTGLASPRYAVREQAAKDLVASGRAGLRAVHRGLTHPDAEVAERARRLLPLVEAEGIRQRLAQMRALLIAYPPPRVPGSEPLVRRFLAVTGDTAAARELYFRMYTDHWKLLDAVEMSDPRGAGRAFWAYVDESLMYPDGRKSVNLSAQTYNRPDLALFWFLSADAGVGPAGCRGVSRPDFPYYTTKHAQGHLSGSYSTPEMRRLFARWLAGPRNVQDPEVDRRMALAGFELALQARLADLASGVHQVAADRNQKRGVRVEALFAIMRAGAVGDVDRVDATITDDTIVYLPSPIQGPGRKVLVGDIALAACVRLSGRRLAEFGFPDAREAEADPKDLRHYGFASDDDRAAARKKWAVWNTARTLIPGGRP